MHDFTTYLTIGNMLITKLLKLLIVIMKHVPYVDISNILIVNVCSSLTPLMGTKQWSSDEIDNSIFS